jgi:DNA-binding Lrp family transcriptional regulator
VRNGLIPKVTYTLNYQNLGLILYRVLLGIVQFDRKRVGDLYDFCSSNPNIINYVEVMGNWQLMLDIEIESREGLRDLVREIKNQFKDVVHRIEINEIYKMDKFTQMAIEFPELLEKGGPQ